MNGKWKDGERRTALSSGKSDKDYGNGSGHMERVPQSEPPNCFSWYSAYQKTIFEDGADPGNRPIEVYYPESEPSIEDGMLHSQIVFALFADPYVDESHIDVQVEDGWVWLNGTVKNYREKYRAGSIAVRVSRAHVVKNNLDILSRNTLLDKSIAVEILLKTSGR